MFGKPNPDATQEISVLPVHLDEPSLNLLTRLINSLPGFNVRPAVHQYFAEKDASLIRTLREVHPDVCVIDLDRDRQLALETVEYIRRISVTPTSIFAVSTRMDSDAIIQAMRAGCTEYLAKPLVNERLQEAMVQLAHKKRDTFAPAAQGRLITLMGVKGGVGTTSLAVHLAYSLATQKNSVLLIDHHVELGDTTLHLGLEHHNYGFYELACNLNRMDAELLQGFVLKHESGLEVLTSPEGIGMTPKVTAEAIQQTLRFLLRMYDYIVIDSEQRFDEHNLAVLELTDELALITTPQLPAVRSTARYLDYLTRLNYPASKTQVILNRWSKRSPVSVEHIEKALCRKLSLIIPAADQELGEALATGVPVSLKSRSDFMQNISKWSSRLGGSLDPKPATEVERVQQARSRFNVLGISG